ncbi:MAG: phosphate/phosphite/phosphonate ABC transporter substrate-binding protein [Anaerolineales bacterium]|nr:phosphate/phosphite/phosphonate ABC transporter substrate-binding protein [Anaerolineales bacterium]
MAKTLGAFLAVLALAAGLSACNPDLGDRKGTEENPFTWVLVPSIDPITVQNGAEAIAAFIKEEKGIVIEPIVADSFLAAVDMLCAGEADMGALNTFGYLVAHDLRGCAEVGLVSERFGTTFYQGQIVIGADSEIASISDLKGQTFCRPDPTSTSGWIIPSLSMLAQGVEPESDLGAITESDGHDGVIRDVYAGTCQAGATFADARRNVEVEIPDVYDRVLVLLETVPIPNDNISYATAVLPSDRERLNEAFLSLTGSELGLSLLMIPQNWEGLMVQEDRFYDGFRRLLREAEINIEEFVIAGQA